MKSTIPLFLPLLLLAACQSATATPTSSTTSLPAPTATEPLPSATLPPKSTPTPRLYPLPDHIDLPDWLGDPAASLFVILAEQVNEGYSLAFFNAETQERFDLKITETAAYFWTQDGRNFGLVEAHSLRVHLIDLTDGSVQSYELSEKSLRPVILDGNLRTQIETYREDDNPLPHALSAYGNDPSHPDFHLLNRRNPGTRYILSQYYSDDYPDTRTEVTDLQTGESFLLTPGNDEVDDKEMVLSPDGDRVAIIQGELTYTWYQPGTHISIYSIATREFLSQYEGPFFDMAWSPDEQEIIYSIRPSEDIFLSDFFTPCILTLATGESRCLNGIERFFQSVPETAIIGFGYSNDGERIYFRYQQRPPQDDFYYLFYGGICYFVLSNGKINCPSDQYDPELIQTPHSMLFSPDERYVAFDSAFFSRFSDDQSPPPVLNVLGIQESSLLHIGQPDDSIRQKFFYPTDTFLWRPTIQP